MNAQPSRRHILRMALLAGTARPYCGVVAATHRPRLLVCGFAKHLRGLPTAEIARIAAAAGLDGSAQKGLSFTIQNQRRSLPFGISLSVLLNRVRKRLKM